MVMVLHVKQSTDCKFLFMHNLDSKLLHRDLSSYCQFCSQVASCCKENSSSYCSVNLQGHTDKKIELDAFVESEVVKPLTLYCTGHTTVKMCERVMGNIDFFKKVRGAYKSPDSFNVHHTSRHSEQNPFPDHLKSAWFCLRSGFFENK